MDNGKTYQVLWKVAKAVFMGKCIALKARSRERLKT